MDGAAARADLLLPPHSPIRSQPGAWASPNPSWVAGPLALAGKECADPRAVPRAALDVERGRKTIHGLPTNVPPPPSPPLLRLHFLPHLSAPEQAPTLCRGSYRANRLVQKYPQYSKQIVSEFATTADWS